VESSPISPEIAMHLSDNAAATTLEALIAQDAPESLATARRLLRTALLLERADTVQAVSRYLHQEPQP
jgi:hypothetical protein